MSPNINSGDVVVTETTEIAEIQIGEVITFKQPTAVGSEIYVTHRVINIVTKNGITQFQTKGDANEEPDIELVTSSNLIGKVVFTVPDIGYLPDNIKIPIGFILIISLPASLLIVGEVRNVIKSRRKKREIIYSRKG